MRVVASWWLVGCLLVGTVACGESTEAPVGGSGSPPAERVTHRTPAGKVEIDTQADLDELGVEVYPGAKMVTEDGVGVSRMETPAGVHVSCRFRTDASVREVADWYTEKLGAETAVVTGESAMVMTEKDGTVVQVICGETEDGGAREIVLTTTRSK